MQSINTPHRLVCLLLIVALLLGACASPSAPLPTASSPALPTVLPPTSAPAPEPTTEPLTTSPEPEMRVVKDLVFASPVQAGGTERLLDVYAPAAASDWPTVLILPRPEDGKEEYRYQELAHSFSEQGAVVFVAGLTSVPPEDLLQKDGGGGLRAELESVTCAVRFARSQADEYGGQSNKVLLVSDWIGGYYALWATLAGNDVNAAWDDFGAARGGPPRQLNCAAPDKYSGAPESLVTFQGHFGYFEVVEGLKEDDPALYDFINPASRIGGNPEAALQLITATQDFITPQSVQTLNRQVYEALRADGYDVAWTKASIGPTFTAIARQEVLNAALLVVAPPPPTVVKDLPYTTSTRPGGAGWLLDVYAPAVASDWPAVVIFHGGGGNKESYGYQVLAQSIAAEGAVVFFPSLTPDEGSQLFHTENGAGLREDLEATICAVRFARAKAVEYGGVSDQVLVFGHSGGGWDGILTALVGDEMEAQWDAFAETRGGPPRQMECVEGETLSGRPDVFLGYAGAYTYFYQVENEDPELFQLVHPPTYVGRNTDVVLRFIVAAREFVMPEKLTRLNEEFFESLRVADHDVAVTIADGSHMLEAPARTAVMRELRKMFNR